jgi:hypothetical protein
VVVVAVVVRVALAPPDALNVDGLTVHTGFDTVPPTDGVTVHPNVMGPTKVLPATMVMFADEVPPGATASGERLELTVIVKSVCAEARGTASAAAANRQHTMRTRPDQNLNQDFTFDSNHWDLNMSRVGYQYPSIPGIIKKLPAGPANFRSIFGIQARSAD